MKAESLSSPNERWVTDTNKLGRQALDIKREIVLGWS